MCESRTEVKQDDIGVFYRHMIFLCSVHFNEFAKHSEARNTSKPTLKYDVILYYSDCITFASKSVFQVLNIITILIRTLRSREAGEGVGATAPLQKAIFTILECHH